MLQNLKRLSMTTLVAAATVVYLAGCGSGSDAVPLASGGAKLAYVVQGSNGPWSVLEFPAPANGNMAPIATLTLPAGFTVTSLTTDSTGQLYVGLRPQNLNVGFGEVLVYAAGASGTATPLRTILGSTTAGSASFLVPVVYGFDSAGSLYVSNNGIVFVFPPTANGVATPLRTLGGSLTQFDAGSPPLYQTELRGAALDPSGNLFITTAGNILLFPPGATGNVTPARTFPGTLGTIATDAAGNLYVLNNLSNSVIREYNSQTGALLRTISAPDHDVNPSAQIFYDLGQFQVDAVGNIYFMGLVSTPTGMTLTNGLPAYGNTVPVIGTFGAGASDPPNAGYVTPTTVMTSDSWTAIYAGFQLTLR